MLISAGLLMAVAAAVYAVSYNQYIFKNWIETSRVDIELNQYEISEDGQRQLLEGRRVLPGQSVSYIPEVTNRGTECYVRVRFDIDSDQDAQISLDDVSGIGGEWVRKGNCFYRTETMKPGESCSVFEKLNIPESWSMQSASGFTIDAVADAIQARNFDPDFNSSMPWGNIEIEDSVDKGNAHTHAAVKQSGDKIRVVYTKDEKFESSTDNLFSQFDSMQPGDVCSQRLPIKNKCADSIKVYFRTETENTDLLSEVNLVIKSEGKEMYNGPLSSEKLNSFTPIAKIPGRGEKSIDFQLSLPEDAGNAYAQLEDNVTWIIAVKNDDRAGLTKTGDSSGFMAAVMLAICTMMLIIIVAVFLWNSRKKS